VDAHLVLDEIQLGERYIQLTRREECASLRSVSVKLLGAPGLTLEECDPFRGVVTGGGEAGGGGATFLAASWLAMTARNLFSVLFIARVASACSLSLFSICWNLSSSMAGESTTVDDFYGGGTGGSRS
jgi:hypothetical protein